MKKRFTFLFLLLLFMSTTIKAAVSQPTIFDKENFNTIDFLALLKSHSRDEFISEADEQTTDAKAELIKQSGADIYVEAEINCVESPSGNSCDVILTAYKTSTGESLANAHGNSGQYYTTDFGRLGALATKRLMTSFIQTMQNKFDQISQDGNAIRLSIGFGHSGFNADTLSSNGLPFSDVFEDWITTHSNKGNYHIQGVSTNKIVYDRVNIPLQDKDGNAYTVSKFSRDLYSYFVSLGLKVQRTVEGNSINFTLDN